VTQLINRHHNESAVFRVRVRSGVWEVARDGAFVADYLSRRDAVAGARAAAASFEAMGGVADVVTPSLSSGGARRRRSAGSQ
jgi:hypothetical protein